MGRIKFRIKNSFAGRRKKQHLPKKKVEQESSTIPNPIVGHDFVETTASARKFEAFGITMDGLNEPVEKLTEQEDCFFIMQLMCMNALFKNLACPQCLQSDVLTAKLAKDGHCGLSSKLEVACSECEDVVVRQYSCQRVGDAHSSNVPFDVNIHAVFAFRGVGCGFSAIKKWCGLMNFPSCLAYNTYSSNLTKLESSSRQTFEEIKKTTGKAIRDAYADVVVLPDQDGVLNIAVSYDGSWQKRGHSSHNEVGCVIDLLTGLPIDYVVLSNFCLKCKIGSSKSEETTDWQTRHARNCPKNYAGNQILWRWNVREGCGQGQWKGTSHDIQLFFQMMTVSHMMR